MAEERRCRSEGKRTEKMEGGEGEVGRGGRKEERQDRKEGKRGKHGVRGWIESGIGLPRAWQCSAHSPGWVNVCKTNQSKLCPQRAQGTQHRSFRRGLSFKAHCRQKCSLNTGCCLSPLKEDLGASWLHGHGWEEKSRVVRAGLQKRK